MRKISLVGMRFGRLSVLNQSQEVGNRKQIKWDCICDCGNKKTVEGGSLKTGSSRSCGCLALECQPSVTHGLSKSRIYRIYRHMINRCYNEKVDSYPLYGGRGITVCDAWRTFEPFYQWAMQNGYADDLSIDRKDNDQGYSPCNCQWSTEIEQARNKRNTVASIEIAEEIRALRSAGVRNRDIATKFNLTRTTISDITYHKSWAKHSSDRTMANKVDMLAFDGQTKTATAWAKAPGIDVTYSTILRRKRQGMSDYDALFSKKKTHTTKSKLKALQAEQKESA